MILHSIRSRPTPGLVVAGNCRRAFRSQGGMSLVELLVVMAIISVLLTLGVSAFRKASQGSPLDNALGGIAAGMDLARQTAISQATYTWVALAEGKDSSGANEVSMAILASKSGDLANRKSQDFHLLSRVERFPGVRLVEKQDWGILNNVKTPASTDTGGEWEPSDPDTAGGFPIPLDGLPNAPGGAERTFKQVVMFTPRGAAAVDKGEESFALLPLYRALQVVLVPSKGPAPSEIEKKSASVVYLNGVTGLSTVYRPSAL